MLGIVSVMVLPERVICPACVLRLLQPVTMVGVMVGVFVIVGLSVGEAVMVGDGVMDAVAVKMGVLVGVSVGVLDGVKVGVATVGVLVGVEGLNVEGGTVTIIATLTKTVRALRAFIGFGGVLS